MKFSRVLFFATAVTALPAMSEKVAERDLIERQTQSSAIGTLGQLVSNLGTSTSTTIGAVNSAVNGIKSNAGAAIAVQVQATLKANLQLIAQALQASVGNIVTAYTNLTTNLAGNLATVSANDINALVTAVKSTLGLLGQITSLLVSISTNLPSDVKTLVSDETTAIQNSVVQLIGPVTNFVNSATGSLTFSSNAPAFLASIIQIVTQLLSGLGVSAGALNINSLPLGPS